MSLSDAEGTDYGDDEFHISQADYDKIDAHVSALYASPTNSTHGTGTGGPLLPIALEAEADAFDSIKATPQAASSAAVNSAAKPKSNKGAMSPYRRYRAWRRSFSVTDLVSPAWYVLPIRER